MKKRTVKTGIDICIDNQFKTFRSARIGLLSHQASVSSNIILTQNLFIKHCKVYALFGPEHGIYGNEQAMISVENNNIASLPIYSLYGDTLKPTEKMIKNIDIMVIDLQDIGTRYYTFIWTMLLTLQVCAEYKKSVVVFDRPNPINGITIEGASLSEGFSSFVGLFNIPVRHGMTIGELALLFNEELKIHCDLKVIKMQNWKREMWFEDTGLPWVLPSPNMPTVCTAILYPGMCLIEGTNVSEGRGTTMPFKFIGAPWIGPFEFAQELNALKLSAIVFRPIYFTPSFSKFNNKTCGGVQLHVTDRNKFESFITGVKIIQVIHNYYRKFKWAKPPYEYEHVKMPFDILTGNSTIRTHIEKNKSLVNLRQQWVEENKKFKVKRQKYLLYAA